MEMLVKEKYRETLTDIGLLIMRVWAGLTMFWAHGKGKMLNFSDRADSFPDPFGIGSPASLALTVGSEVFCAILLVLGVATRLVSIPLLITMGVAAYMHGVVWGDPFGDYELALLFGTIFLMFTLTGPGKYSVDHLIEQGWKARKSD